MTSDAERAEERLRVLTDAMRTFAEATTDLGQLLEAVARNVAEVLKDSCVVLVLSEDGQCLLPRAAHAIDADAKERILQLVDAEPFWLETHPAARHLLETRSALLLPHLTEETLKAQTTTAYSTYQREQGVHSLLAVALHAHGKPLGLLTLNRYRPSSPAFAERDRDLAQNLADHASLAIANAKLYETERIARYAAEEAMRSKREAVAALERARAEAEAEARFREQLEATQKELLEAKEAAEAANRGLEAFSYSVAHDLRAPLRSMKGFSTLLLEDYEAKLDDEGKSMLGHIVTSATEMAALIEGLLALARLSRAPLHREPVDLSALAADALVRATNDAQVRAPFEAGIAKGLVAEADPTLARSVVENLVGNAVKFSSKTPAPRIEVGQLERDGERVFFVRDNGAGFDPAYAGKLFTPFKRLHATADFAGTGIGLATVHRIVERHGGRIWAEGRVGEGATFYFTLPTH